jgi:hypothetical protein
MFSGRLPMGYLDHMVSPEGRMKWTREDRSDYFAEKSEASELPVIGAWKIGWSDG